LISAANRLEDLREKLRVELGLLQFLHELPARAHRDPFAGESELHALAYEKLRFSASVSGAADEVRAAWIGPEELKGVRLQFVARHERVEIDLLKGAKLVKEPVHSHVQDACLRALAAHDAVAAFHAAPASA
jgi:hypothetical protein